MKALEKYIFSQFDKSKNRENLIFDKYDNDRYIVFLLPFY